MCAPRSAAAVSADAAQNTPPSPDTIISAGEQAKGYFDRAADLVAHFGLNLKQILVTHPLHVAALVGIAYVVWKNWAVLKERVEDYRTGKVL